MTIEPIPVLPGEPGEGHADVERRAQLHAALAEPLRLRIVDLLSLGDASPTEFQTVLGITSSLLAHHVRILEQAGIVERHRSQADRRRSYLQLQPHALTAATPGTAAPAAVPRVVFVCTANSARSQLAAALWRTASDVPVTSAGTHPADTIAAGAAAAARRHGLELTAARPRSLDAVLEQGDYIVTVCDNAHEELAADAAPPVVSQLHWSVPDPAFTGTDDAFDEAFDDLARRVTRLAPRLAAC